MGIMVALYSYKPYKLKNAKRKTLYINEGAQENENLMSKSLPFEQATAFNELHVLEFCKA